MVQKVAGSIPVSRPRYDTRERRTAVSIQVFQTWDEVSTTSARTIPLERGFFVAKSDQTAKVAARVKNPENFHGLIFVVHLIEN